VRRRRGRRPVGCFWRGVFWGEGRGGGGERPAAESRLRRPAAVAARREGEEERGGGCVTPAAASLALPAHEAARLAADAHAVETERKARLMPNGARGSPPRERKEEARARRRHTPRPPSFAARDRRNRSRGRRRAIRQCAAGSSGDVGRDWTHLGAAGAHAGGRAGGGKGGHCFFFLRGREEGGCVVFVRVSWRAATEALGRKKARETSRCVARRPGGRPPPSSI
jgi:hypothetical protein